MADLLRLNDYVQQGFQQGRERHEKATLAKLYSQALAAPEDQQAGMVQQMAAVNPDFANSAQTNFSNGRKQAYDDLGREAGMFVALAQSGDPATAQAAYTRLAQKAQAAGHPVPPTYDPKMLPMIQKLASTVVGGAQLAPRVIGNALVDPSGKVLYQGEQQQAKPVFQTDKDGNGYWLTPGQAPIPVDFPQQGAQQPPTDSGVPVQAGAMLDPTKDYPQLAANFPGTQISSLFRTPEHNAAVGGVANSQHMRGTAGDFVVPKAEQAAFISKAKAEGYEVIPEGDHIHIELPNGRQAANTFAQNGGRIQFPVKGGKSASAPSGYQFKADGKTLEPIPGGPADTGGDYQLSHEAINNAAWDFIMTGTKPQFARSHEGDKQRIAIQNEVADIARKAGVSPQELSTQKGKFKALQSSLSNIQKQSDMMDKANETFHRNADLMLSLSSKVPRYDAATINKYVLDYRLKWSGDPATAAYIAAARTAINEYAKIASGASGAAGSTDSSRREAEEAISSAQSPQQLAAVIKTLKQDAENQKNATHDQIIEIGSRMTQFGKSAGGEKANNDPLGIL